MADPFAYGVDYLSSTLGLPPEVARGAVNYMYRNESGLDPMATNPSSGAFGIGQHLGSRKTALVSQYGSAPTMEQQYAFIADELKSGRDGGNTLAKLRNARSEQDAYNIWGHSYERPGNAALAKAGVREGYYHGEGEAGPSLHVTVAPGRDQELPPGLFLDGLLGGKTGAEDEKPADDPLAMLDSLLGMPGAPGGVKQAATQPVSEGTYPVPSQPPVTPSEPAQPLGPAPPLDQGSATLLDKLLGGLSPIGTAEAAGIPTITGKNIPRIESNATRALSRAEQLPENPFLVFDVRQPHGYLGVFPTDAQALDFIKSRPDANHLDFGTPRQIEHLNPSGPESPEYDVAQLKKAFMQAMSANENDPRVLAAVAAVVGGAGAGAAGSAQAAPSTTAKSSADAPGFLDSLLKAASDPDVAGGTESRTPPPTAGPGGLGGFFSGFGQGVALPGEELKARLPGMTGMEQAGAAVGRIPGGMVDALRGAGQMTQQAQQGNLAGITEEAWGPAMFGLGAAPRGALGTGIGRGPGFAPKTEPTSALGKAAATVRKEINAVFSPTTVDPLSLEAEALIRQSTGLARRSTEVAGAAVEPHRALVNPHIPEFDAWMRANKAGTLPPGAPKPELLKFLDFVEGRSAGARYDGPPELLPLADELKRIYAERRAAIEAEPTTEKASFIEDYYSHSWKERETVRAAAAVGGQGSGRNLKERTIPTISEGIERGYTPTSLDPIATTMTYVANMGRYLAHNRTFRISHDAGIVQFHTPGAQPEGWVALQGRMTERAGTKAYAPEAFARIYNNSVSSGVYASRLGGDAYNVVAKTKNALNSFVLGLSGYHAAAMAQEASASALARAIGGLTEGEMAHAAKQIGLGGMPVAKSVNDVLTTGRKLQRQYLKVDDYGADYEKVAGLLAEGGGRVVGRGQEWRGTEADNFFKSWKRGAIKLEMQAAGREITENPWRAPLVAARELARINDTIMAPIFDGMIPRLKSAAFFDEMSAWLRNNPEASRTDQLKKSRELIDVVDDRFGEMILDNIFWSKTAKQLLQLGTVSLGWELGTIRSGAGGAADLARGKPLSPRVRYLVGLAGAVAIYNSTYEYLMTGTGPQSAKDLVTSRTGGKTPEGEPERALLPGYEKDALGWWHHPTTEPFNKISPLIRLTSEIFTNRDYFGREIAPFAPGTPDWFKAYGGHVLSSMVPIPFKAETLKGTAIPTWQRFMGVRPAPEYIQNPQRYDDMETRRRLGGLKSELRGVYTHGARTQDERAKIEERATEVRRRIQKTQDEWQKRKMGRQPTPRSSLTVAPD